MIWNNGDGNDTNEGGDGADETLVTEGTAADDTHVTAPVAGRFFLNRTNAPFSVDMDTVEKLTLTTFSGDDKLDVAPGIALNMNVDAGSGNDTISTGDGNDVVLGGDGNDTLNGAGGGDRLVGERGTDTMNGGAGDDTLVWNNGEGSDVMNGDDGVDRIETNLSGIDDVSTLKPDGARIRYDRTNQGQFNLSIASAEAFELNELGGNDTLVTSPGLTLPVVADGGAGNDLFSVRDNSPSFVFGGSGADTATIDADDSVAADVEAVDRPTVQPSPSPSRPPAWPSWSWPPRSRGLVSLKPRARPASCCRAPPRCRAPRRSSSARSRPSSRSAAPRTADSRARRRRSSSSPTPARPGWPPRRSWRRPSRLGHRQGVEAHLSSEHPGLTTAVTLCNSRGRRPAHPRRRPPGHRASRMA